MSTKNIRNFKGDFNKATEFFINNQTKLEDCLNGKLISIELDNTKLAKFIDRVAGIDYFFINKNEEVFGVSARINFNPTMFNSITIRCSRGHKKRYKNVEFQKGIKAYQKKELPIIAAYGLQMDAKGKDLTEFIIYDRKELFLYSYNNFDKIKNEKLNTVKQDGNTYLKFEFSDLKKIGIWHKIFKIS